VDTGQWLGHWGLLQRNNVTIWGSHLSSGTARLGRAGVIKKSLCERVTKEHGRQQRSEGSMGPLGAVAGETPVETPGGGARSSRGSRGPLVSVTAQPPSSPSSPSLSGGSASSTFHS
jgi:hypothetical protein